MLESAEFWTMPAQGVAGHSEQGPTAVIQPGGDKALMDEVI